MSISTQYIQAAAASYSNAILQSQPTRYVATTSTNSSDSSTEEDSNVQGRDTVSLSPNGLRLSQNPPDSAKKVQQSPESANNGMTPDEQRMILELKKRDLEVKNHEQAHLAAAGQYAAGGPSYTYQTGPDGKRYAVGGEVPIDTGKERTPEQTIQKMRAVRAAALAPANPSGADRQIAATASSREAEARQEMQKEQGSETGLDAQDGTSSSEQTASENDRAANTTHRSFVAAEAG